MTQSEAKEFWPIIKAWADGATMQFAGNNGVWKDVSSGLAFDGPISDYRIKPAPKLRPWKSADEVPLGCQVRRKDGDIAIRWLVVGADEHCIVTCLSGFPDRCDYAATLEKLEHSTDGGKTWKPCGVEE